MKKLLILLAGIMVIFTLNITRAQSSPNATEGINYPTLSQEGFTLIPEDNGAGENAVENVLNGTGSFVEKYKQTASGLSMEAQLNSGIVNFKGIMGFLVHLVRLLLDAAMVIGFLMIVYSGYIYASGVFTGNVTKGNNAIKNAVIGLLIVIFSYTIIKIVTAMFL